MVQNIVLLFRSVSTLATLPSPLLVMRTLLCSALIPLSAVATYAWRYGHAPLPCLMPLPAMLCNRNQLISPTLQLQKTSPCTLPPLPAVRCLTYKHKVHQHCCSTYCCCSCTPTTSTQNQALHPSTPVCCAASDIQDRYSSIANLLLLQLYINYKLKSVAALPWRQMTFKFLNTIVDDLFAFVIKMPWLHRLSVFRDDLVFLVYIYQRWAYRVDKRRPNEFGYAPLPCTCSCVCTREVGVVLLLPEAHSSMVRE